jgi:hypothetical protein
VESEFGHLTSAQSALSPATTTESYMPRHWRSYRREPITNNGLLLTLVIILLLLAVTSPFWAPLLMICLLVILALSLAPKIGIGALIVIILLCCLLRR